MSWGGFLSWYYQYFPFIWQNEIYHIIAGLFIVTILYPFLNTAFRVRKNYVMFLLVPGLLGSVFPDLVFSVYTVVKNWSFNMALLEEGTWLHSLFHGWWSLLVVPVALLLVGGITILVEWISKKKEELPKWWWIWVAVLSLFCTILHLVMDSVGF